MTEEKQYSYFAFISYSSKDGRWARWLQNRLETYRLPAAVRRDHADAPKRIAPIFRDKTDMTGGYLREQLHRQLEDSRYLILICSPNGAASDWVDREARHFIESGREKQIIPFVVGGKPGSCREYFPPALRERSDDSLLGINVTEIGRTGAFLRVVATMLGLKYDELVRRHRKRMLRRGAAAGVCAAAALAAVAGAWWYYTPHSAYYANYTTRYEIPEGINELSTQQRQGLAEFYHIVTRKGKPVLLERVNAAGDLVDPLVMATTVEYPKTEFIYNDEGRIDRAELYDTSGRKVLQKTFTYDLENQRIAIDYQQPGNSLQALTMLGSTGEYFEYGYDYRSDIARRLNTYDENGLLAESRYLRDNRNDPACDANGVYGTRFVCNEQGLVVQAFSLDESGGVHASRYGVAEERIVYDDAARIVLAAMYGSDGQLVRGESGFAQMQIEYDEKGNVAATSYLDEGGMPCTSSEQFSRMEFTYDDQGRRVREQVYDVAGKPAYDNQGGVCDARYAFDEAGHIVLIAYFDGDGEPVYDSNGCCEIHFSYDEQGRETSRLAYDTHGQLCGGFNGMAGYAFTYDEYGFIQTVTNIGTDGEPGANADGYVTMRCVNDSMGNRLRAEALDENGALTEDNYGVAGYECGYDSIGNQVSVSYFDAKQEPCLRSGSSQIRYEYENGNLVSESYFGVDGEPVSPDGWHEERIGYDDRGNVVSRSYFDEQGEPVRSGYARIELTVDSWGNELERRYFDADGMPVQYDNGSVQYWRREQEYDRWGNLVRESYESLTGEYPNGYSTVLVDYDGRHNPIRYRYLDENGQPSEDEDGASTLINTYDERNLLIRQAYLDKDGLPGNDYGITAVEQQYDERGRMTRGLYWRPDGRGGEELDYQIVYTYDEYGNRISREVLDADGEPEGGHVQAIRTAQTTEQAQRQGLVQGSVLLMWNSWTYFQYDQYSEASAAFEEEYQKDYDVAIFVAACPREDGTYSRAVGFLTAEEAEGLQFVRSNISTDDIKQFLETFRDWIS